jgi:hypothetical protein
MGCISNAPNYAQNIPSVHKWCTKTDDLGHGNEVAQVPQFHGWF